MKKQTVYKCGFGDCVEILNTIYNGGWGGMWAKGVDEKYEDTPLNLIDIIDKMRRTIDKSQVCYLVDYLRGDYDKFYRIKQNGELEPWGDESDYVEVDPRDNSINVWCEDTMEWHFEEIGITWTIDGFIFKKECESIDEEKKKAIGEDFGEILKDLIEPILPS